MSEMDGNLMNRINNLWSGLDIVEADVGITDAIRPIVTSCKRTFVDSMTQQVLRNQDHFEQCIYCCLSNKLRV